MFNKIKRFYNTIAVILLNIVVMLVIVELCSAAVIGSYWYFGSYSPWKDMEYYEQQEWSVEYWREATPRTGMYAPFVSWKSSPFDGNLINITEEGLRATENSVVNADISIFCFGGSTMWGWGSPDWGTIPSYLAKIANEKLEVSVSVINFGQRTYITSQEVIQLIEEIKQGNIPDIVIFYDGINDIGYAWNYGKAGIPYDMWKIARQSHVEAVSKQGNMQKAMDMFMDSNFGRLVKSGISFLSSRLDMHQLVLPFGTDTDIDLLAEDTVSVYLSNMNIVDALSKQYGFDYYFFWQPSIQEESKPLTYEEQAMKQQIINASGGRVIAFRHATYELMKLEAEKHKNLYYIADVFDNTEDFMFIDGCHLVPEGNRIIAGRMIDVIFRNR